MTVPGTDADGEQARKRALVLRRESIAAKLLTYVGDAAGAQDLRVLMCESAEGARTIAAST